jgi:hypothetical protein
MTSPIYFNHNEPSKRSEAKDSYEVLKEWLKQDIDFAKSNNIDLQSETLTTRKLLPALRHMIYMEDKIERMENELKEYKNLFILLGKFIPIQPR